MLTNWAETLIIAPSELIEPRTLTELRLALRGLLDGKQVRPVGQLYSFSDCIQTHDALLRMPDMAEVRAGSRDEKGPLAPLLTSDAWSAHEGYAYVRGGTRIHQLCEEARALGLCPYTLGGSSGQTVIGAVSTSTHGADFGLGPLPEFVVALHLVTPSRDYWLERRGRVWVDDDHLAELLEDPHELRIVRKQDSLDAALVSLGAAGVVAGALIALRASTWMNERVFDRVGWSDVLAALADRDAAGQPVEPPAFRTPPGQPTDDVPPGNYRYLEIALNAYDTPATGIVVARNQATRSEIDAVANALRDPARLERSSPDLVGFAFAMNNDPDRAGAVRSLMRSSRLTGAASQRAQGAKAKWVYWEMGSVLDVGIPDKVPVVACELVWNAAHRTEKDSKDPDYVRFLGAFAQQVQASVLADMPFLGTLTLRFSRGTTAHMGMQYSASPMSDRFAHVEISALQDVKQAAGEMPRLLPDDNRALLNAVLAHPAAASARLHWGQAQLGATKFDARIYPKVAVWRARIADLVGDDAARFRSPFLSAIHALP